MTTYTWDHVHIRSPDPEATAQYFERMFGAEIIRTMQQGQPRIDLKLGGANIFVALVPAGSKVNPQPTTPYQGLDHFGLTVSGIDAVVAELKAKGVDVFREDQRDEGVFTGRSAYFHDPDNNALEVIHLTNNAKA